MRFSTPLAATLLIALASCVEDPGKSNSGPDRGRHNDTDEGDDDSGGRDSGGRDSGGRDVGVEDNGGGGGDTTGTTDLSPRDQGGGTTDLSPVDAAPTGEGITGGVAVLEFRGDATDELNQGAIAAELKRGTTSPTPPTATFGPCEVRPTDPSSSTPAPQPSLDAGQITIAIGGETHTLTRDGASIYQSSASGRIEFFNGGDSISFSSAGGSDVPSFAGSLTAPAEPTVLSPSWSPMGSGLSRSMPLSVQWAGTGSGDVVISVVPATTDGVADGSLITCVVPDTGSYTVDAGALSYLPTGSLFDPIFAALTVTRPVSSDVNAGLAVITLNATAAHTIVGPID